MKKILIKIKSYMTLSVLGWTLLCSLPFILGGMQWYCNHQINHSEEIYRNSVDQEFTFSETSSKLYLKGTGIYLEDIGYYQDGVPDFRFEYEASQSVNSPGAYTKHKPTEKEILLFQKERALAKLFYASRKN